MAHFQEKLFDEYDDDEQDYETHLATYVEELSAKRYETALESCEGMLEASPKDAEAALCRALVHALRGDDDEEDDDYCTLWLKRCDRWRVDGEDCMGVPWGAPDDLNTFMAMVNNVPDDWTFSAFGLGRHQMAYVAASVLAGGNVRVGLEDNLWLDKGVLAENWQLVERAGTIIENMGARVIGPAQVREQLGLTKRAAA